MLPSTPSPERLALNRASFGARADEVIAAEDMGWTAWVDDQLNPPEGDDPAMAATLGETTLHIEYEDGRQDEGTWEEVDEDRPLVTLSFSQSDLFGIIEQVWEDELPWDEIWRVYQEVYSATWVRAVHSRYQVRELMVDFWHNHFNIAAEENERVMVSLPVYDRDVIRANSLGNFREMLEAVATSAGMLVYLDNAVSTAEHPNENYARELIELHTIGADRYHGLSHTDPADIEASQNGGTVSGFIDDDVIAASRALSGWTIEQGQWIGGGQGRMDFTGEFMFLDAWHNTEAGMFMGTDLQNYSGMAQGQAVLDILANHEGTAEFVVGKICRRFFGDQTPEDVLSTAISVWRDNLDSPRQIALVMESILLSDAFTETPSVKLRRPFEKTVAFMRATESQVRPNDFLQWIISGNKDTVFSWPAPNGHPDADGYWMNTTALLSTWNAMLGLTYTGTAEVSITGQTPPVDSLDEFLEYWTGRLVGYELSTEAADALYWDAYGPEGIMNTLKWGDDEEIENSARRVVAMIASSPEFAYR